VSESVSFFGYHSRIAYLSPIRACSNPSRNGVIFAPRAITHDMLETGCHSYLITSSQSKKKNLGKKICKNLVNVFDDFIRVHNFFNLW